MKPCPECCTEVPEEAAACYACGRRIVGKQCPVCAELSKAEARKCPFCSHDFAREEKIAVVEPYSAKAAFLPTLLLRGRFIPQEIQISSEKIVIKTWGRFFLSHTDEDIPWEKIAGYDFHSGWFWDGIDIQTRGQTANTIGCLRKSSSRKIKQTLEQMKE